MTPAPKTALPPFAKKSHRILFLQLSSIIEKFGGIEYYQDDFLTLATEIYSPVAVHALIPQRTNSPSVAERPYRMTLVRYSPSKVFSKIENRFSTSYLRAAFHVAKHFRPTLVIAGHVHMSPIAYALMLRNKIPYLVNVHGIECWGPQLFPYEWCLKHAKGILPTSYWTKRVLVERGFSAAKIKVVQPRLPTAYEKFPAPRRPKAEGERFTLLTVSRLDAQEQYKGQDHVLQALYRLRQTEPSLSLRYIIQGEGTDRPRLEALAKELKIDDIVEFHAGVKDRMEFEHVYRQADLFVMPSRFGVINGKWCGEGFGIVYLEAAAFGVPSLAYNCGGATDFIKHGVNGMLVAPDDIAELARSIHYLATNPQAHFEMAKKAHEIVMSDFTRGAIRKQIIAALDGF